MISHSTLILWFQFPLGPWEKIIVNVTRSPVNILTVWNVPYCSHSPMTPLWHNSDKLTAFRVSGNGGLRDHRSHCWVQVHKTFLKTQWQCPEWLPLFHLGHGSLRQLTVLNIWPLGWWKILDCAHAVVNAWENLYFFHVLQRKYVAIRNDGHNSYTPCVTLKWSDEDTLFANTVLQQCSCIPWALKPGQFNQPLQYQILWNLSSFLRQWALARSGWLA